MFPANSPRIEPGESLRCGGPRPWSAAGTDGGAGNDKADAALAYEVDHALWRDNVLRMMDYYEIDVHARAGVVTLSGHIAGTSSRVRIENAIRDVPGVARLVNALVLDSTLTMEVASSLGDLEHTYGCKFFTGVSHGVVSLNGTVSDENVRLLAEQCAAGNPNVRGVINHVRIAGAPPALPGQPFLQPAVGEAIYFLDGVSGIVKQVVVNPDNRCVVAMIVLGRFADPWQDPGALDYGEADSAEGLVVVPMSLVRFMTRVSGFLYIRSNETGRYSAFDPAHFLAPGKEWRAPYPYCPDDVLFPLGEAAAKNAVLRPPVSLPLVVAPGERANTDQLVTNDSLGG